MTPGQGCYWDGDDGKAAGQVRQTAAATWSAGAGVALGPIGANEHGFIQVRGPIGPATVTGVGVTTPTAVASGAMCSLDALGQFVVAAGAAYPNAYNDGAPTPTTPGGASLRLWFE
jgi:hypothetical protein